MLLQIIFGYIVFIMLLGTALFLSLNNVAMPDDKKKQLIQNTVTFILYAILLPLIYVAINYWLF